MSCKISTSKWPIPLSFLKSIPSFAFPILKALFLKLFPCLRKNSKYVRSKIMTVSYIFSVSNASLTCLLFRQQFYSLKQTLISQESQQDGFNPSLILLMLLFNH